MVNLNNPTANLPKNSNSNIKKNKSCKFWKILTAILIIVIILLLLTQCESFKNHYCPTEEVKCNDNQSATQSSGEDDNNSATTEIDQCRYQGTWTRIGTYVNDDLIHNTPATLDLFDDSYHSETDLCYNEGNLLVSGENMTMEIENSDCPTGSIPTSYTSTYELECDGAKPLHLTFTIEQSGSIVREEYDRTN